MTAPDVVQAGEVRLARIEAVRALAALGVLIGHVWLLGNADTPERLLEPHWHRLLYGGGYGVFAFFGLSGYLLFWPFVRGGVDLRRYARNRALRILPLYVTASVLLLVLDGEPARMWWRHLLLVQSWWADSLDAIDGPLWSVAVEIQFYVLLPFLAWALLRLPRAGAVAALVALAVGSAVLRRSADDPLWSYQLPATFHFFVGGMLVALLRARWEERPPRALAGPLGRSTLWVAASLPLWGVVMWRVKDEELLVAATFLLVGALALPLRDGAARAALAWRPLALLGVASYSLYVWHLPILRALGSADTGLLVLAGVPLALLAAFASYRLVERPALRRREKWAPAAAAQVRSSP